ncbi:amidohydrolase family protein [Amycolatopsis ultiminotia]|uniref:Amidohydrolase family protein n=1 Tax=Amycolatopsis ultiminotia TaxID=543629 RepID=A0ABP6V5G4_9PSEU
MTSSLSDLPVTAGAARAEGDGPFRRLILKGVTVIDGTGGPAYGPADVVIEGNRIAQVITVGNATSPTQPTEWPGYGSEDHVLDLTGQYLLPGLVDVHAHIGSAQQVPNADYVYKLWLGHGITSIREPGSFFNGLDFTRAEAARSRANEITAPRITPYVFFGEGRSTPIGSPKEAAEWIAGAAERDAGGVKFFGAPPEVFRAALHEARQVGLSTACHHAQQEVARTNALTTARWGLTSIEHFYGLPEAMYGDRTVQRYPGSYNYLDEPARFAAAGEVWTQGPEPGSPRWTDLLDELVSLGTTIDPTFTVYVGTRDAARVRTSEWHSAYTAPQLRSFYEPSPQRHGSFLSDWGTEQEVAWRRNYLRWMAFVEDYKNRGGRVTVGSDAGFVYNLYGFGTISELELLREAGFHPLEVIRAATLHGAELLGVGDERGSIEPGKLADLLVVGENPLENLKVLYGHGHFRVSPRHDGLRTGGVRMTIKDGIVYDAGQLRAAVREIVADHTDRESGSA